MGHGVGWRRIEIARLLRRRRTGFIVITNGGHIIGVVPPLGRILRSARLGLGPRRVCWRLKRRESVLPMIQLSQMEEKGFQIPSASPTPDAQWDAMEMKQQLESALKALPEGNRRVYEMRDLDNLPGEKVAKALGISLAAMKSRLYRARALLRDRLDAALKREL